MAECVESPLSVDNTPPVGERAILSRSKRNGRLSPLGEKPLLTDRKGAFEGMTENITPCAKCGDRNSDWDRDWSKPNKEWKKVVPEEWRDKTLCPWCFVRFAIEMNIHYEPIYRDGVIVELNRIPAPEKS